MGAVEESIGKAVGGCPKAGGPESIKPWGRLFVAAGCLFFLALLAFYIACYRDLIFWDNARPIYAYAIDGRRIYYFARGGRILSELLVYPSPALGFSPKTIAMLFLASNWVHYCTTFIVLAFVINNRRLALAYVVFVCAGHTHSAINAWEGGASASAAFVLAGLLELRRIAPRRLNFLLFACFLCPYAGIFFHPLSVFAFAYVIALRWLTNGRRFDRPLLAAVAGLASAFLIKQFLIAEYESEKTADALKGLSWESLAFNLSYFLQNHPALLIAFAFLAIHFLRHRTLLPLLVLGFSIPYLVLANAVYPPSRANWTYVWHSFGPLYAFITIAIFDPRFDPRPRRFWGLQGLIAALIVAWCAAGLRADLTFMARRREAIFNIYHDRPADDGRRYYLDRFSFQEPLLNCLGLMEESALQVAFDEPAVRFHIETEGYAFSRTPGAIPLNTNSTAPLLIEAINHNVILDYDSMLAARVETGRSIRVPLTIVNDGGAPIASRYDGGKPVFLVHLWIPAGSTRSIWGDKTLLHIDVHRRYTQYLEVQRPPEVAADARFMVCFYIDGKLIHPRAHPSYPAPVD